MDNKNNLEHWEEMISDYRNSKMPAATWCQLKGLKKSTLYYWMKRIKINRAEGDGNIKWASLTHPDQQRPIPNSLITLKIGNFTLEIGRDFEKSALADVLRVVMELC